MNNLIATLIILGICLLIWLILMAILKKLLRKVHPPNNNKRVGLPNSRKDLIIDIVCGLVLLGIIAMIFLTRKFGVSL